MITQVLDNSLPTTPNTQEIEDSHLNIDSHHRHLKNTTKVKEHHYSATKHEEHEGISNIGLPI